MDPTLKTVLVSIGVGTVLALIGYALGEHRSRRDRKSQEVLKKEALAIEAVKERDKAIAQLQADVKELRMELDSHAKAATPITAAMQAMLLAKLTHSHLPKVDALLKKAADDTLTRADAIEFADALAQRENDPDHRIDEAEQIAAKILPDVMRLRELQEEEGTSGHEKTILVSVPATNTVRAEDGGTQEEEKGN